MLFISLLPSDISKTPAKLKMAKLVGRMSKTSAKGADQKEYGRACLRILISYYLATELETLGVDPVGSEKASLGENGL